MVDVAMNTKRFKVLRELISTEEKYIETLEGVVHHFHRPLKKSGLLSMKDFRTLFCGVDGLLPLQYQLKTDLQEAEVHDTSVGRVFIRFVPFLRMYFDYIRSHSLSVQLMMKLNKEPSAQKFRDKLKSLEKKARRSLQSYLISPVQRLPRYMLLLAELKKHTSEDHKHYDSICEALEQVKKTLRNIDDDLLVAENQARMWEVQARTNLVDLLAPHRVIVREGRLKLVTAVVKGLDADSAECMVWLFNDCMVVQLDVTDEQEGSKRRGLFSRLRSKKKIVIGKVFVLSLADCRVTMAGLGEFADSEAGSFKIIRARRNAGDASQLVMLQASSQADALAWARDVTRCVMFGIGLPISTGVKNQLLRARQHETKDAKHGTALLSKVKLRDSWKAVRVDRNAECYWDAATGEMSRMHPSVYKSGVRAMSFVDAPAGSQDMEPASGGAPSACGYGVDNGLGDNTAGGGSEAVSGDGAGASGEAGEGARSGAGGDDTDDHADSMLLNLADTHVTLISENYESSSEGEQDDWSDASTASTDPDERLLTTGPTNSELQAALNGPADISRNSALSKVLLGRTKDVAVNVSARGQNSVLPVVADSEEHRRRKGITKTGRKRSVSTRVRGNPAQVTLAAAGRSKSGRVAPAPAKLSAQEARLARMARVEAMRRRCERKPRGVSAEDASDVPEFQPSSRSELSKRSMRRTPSKKEMCTRKSMGKMLLASALSGRNLREAAGAAIASTAHMPSDVEEEGDGDVDEAGGGDDDLYAEDWDGSVEVAGAGQPQA